MHGEKYAVTLEDHFTKHVMAFPICNKEAVTVANVLVDNYMSVFGMPSRIHSDSGREFVNSVWSQLCDRFQIKKTTTPAYNPNSNIVERFHRTLNQMMRVFIDREDMSWSRYLPACTLAYNTKVHSTTGMTPFMAMFGREARLPIDLILPIHERIAELQITCQSNNR